ncbi:MAG: L-fuconate dehydratase [Planctomycetota bacterium]
MSGPIITGSQVIDVRFPTSDSLDGSDAMHKDPDYSAAYVVLTTDSDLEGHGLTFTLGRGTDLCAAAAQSLCERVVGKSLDDVTANFADVWRELTSDSQFRWLGPEKGVVHLATAGVVNAIWDLWAKVEGKPVWKLLTDMPAEQLVDCIDFRYMSDVLTRDQALEIVKSNDATRDQREQQLLESGFPAYTTSAGWLGYSDEKVKRLCEEGLAEGWRHFKLKVGASLEDDIRRARIMRESIGPDCKMMLDANQRWDVQESIDWMSHLAEFDPWWIEEPTSPDDVVGHAAIAKGVAPIGVATGEQCQNRVIFKQLLQLDAISFCQIDSCRLGGVNEVLAVMLMAKKFGIPVCPHAGGVGLCEYVNHLIMVDYTRIGASLDSRVAEFVDHLHEHFEHPVVIKNAAYMPPTAPGYSATMKPESIAKFTYPDGAFWKERLSGS